MSQAQSISNRINQEAMDIERTIAAVNSASKSFVVNGEEYETQTAVPLPLDLVLRLGKMRAAQAFLMENIKAKEELMTEAECVEFIFKAAPIRPSLMEPKLENLEDYAWATRQMSSVSVNEFLHAEGMASVIGKSIHNGSTIDRLRREVGNKTPIEYIELTQGVKTPIRVKYHIDEVKLSLTYQELHKQHLKWNGIANKFKASVKNFLSSHNEGVKKRNAEAIREVKVLNEDAQSQYVADFNSWRQSEKEARSRFEGIVEKEVNKISKLKIIVPDIFEELIS